MDPLLKPIFTLVHPPENIKRIPTVRTLEELDPLSSHWTPYANESLSPSSQNNGPSPSPLFYGNCSTPPRLREFRHIPSTSELQTLLSTRANQSSSPLGLQQPPLTRKIDHPPILYDTKEIWIYSDAGTSKSSCDALAQKVSELWPQ